jgi:hypothetical protein
VEVVPQSRIVEEAVLGAEGASAEVAVWAAEEAIAEVAAADAQAWAIEEAVGAVVIAEVAAVAAAADDDQILG